ncbi:hypothetical protein ACVINZ_001608 [Mesorhizobium jarvisii]
MNNPQTYTLLRSAALRAIRALALTATKLCRPAGRLRAVLL